MTRRFAFSLPTLVAATLLGLTALTGAADDDGFTPIFNGKDLDGWQGDAELWSVEDGAITGKTTDEKKLPYNKFLIWRGGTPRNFELKATIRLIGNSNSGIQYRSKEMPNVGPFSVGGYQMDIHPSPNYNGMLYDERGRGIVAEVGQKVIVQPDGKKKAYAATDRPNPVKLDEWHEYSIIANGNHLTHKIDSKTTVEIFDHQVSERELEGLIALQLHVGPAMKVQFKNVMLKTLPAGGIIDPGQEALPKTAQPLETIKKAQAPKKTARKKAAAPTGPAPPATALERLKIAKGFKVELVHSVDRDKEGSWVSMTVDPKNRLYVSDQYGKLYRITPSPIGGKPEETKVEAVDVDLGEAQGLLWAFDSLYVVVNRGQKYPSGLYRVRDTNGDDTLDKVDVLRTIEGGGEHGPHAVVLSPNGDSLYVVAGNATRVPELASSKVPYIWGEDNLLPRMVDGAGFMRDEKAPGGWVCKVDPEGKNWELISMGYRNAYDLAFNHRGELFTYDSDMEWDMNLPWYRPTRVCHVVSGSDFGYRNGAGKWPTFYIDGTPPVVDIGPGSPTGIAFGYGAKFPRKYQEALYISDWSYGKLYAIHLKPNKSSYTAEVEEFISGTPLPLTDLVVNPGDGALYFTIGGRRTTSSLYRVVADSQVTETADAPTPVDSASLMARKMIEQYHGVRKPEAVDQAWSMLNHPDRFVRSAARIALEWQDPTSWRDRALTETSPDKAFQALLALIHVSAQDPAHRKPGDPGPDSRLYERILAALANQKWDRLNEQQKLDLARIYQVLFNRFGKPSDDAAQRLIAVFDGAVPSPSRELNVELANLLVYLEAPSAAAKVVGLLEKAPTQEEQIDVARSLRTLATGWTPELRRAYFAWIVKAGGYKGGNSFRGFMKQIRDAAVATLSESEKSSLKDLLDAPAPAQSVAASIPPRPHVKDWTVEELLPIIESGLKSRDYNRGRSLFAAAACFSCHRFNNEGGGAGPELTGLAGRFNTRDLIESIVLPSKVISDQYGAVMISTTDGQVVTGRIVNLHNDAISINTNMLDPNLQTSVDRKKIEEMKPSPISMMPEGLLNTLNRDEVLDLIAYLLSRGDRNADVFK